MAAPTSEMPRELEEGRLFEQRYRIVEQIGSGGFGHIYLAHQEGMDRRVALKVLKSDWEGEKAEKIKQRFLREVRVISKLQHPNTVTIHDFGESANGTLYMVLEYIEGEPLDELLDREGAQPPTRALDFTKQVASSLAEAHRNGIVHRDLKPANIMVTDLETQEDFVKVLDFGVAHVLQNDQPDLTKGGVEEGEMLGTPRYMSPEQVRGDAIDGRADIYCLGLLLYELLVGRPAVDGDTTMALITQQISPEALELDGLQRLPPVIRKIVNRATRKEAQGRYSSTQALIDDIDEAKPIVAEDSSAEMALQEDFASESDPPLGSSRASDDRGERQEAAPTPHANDIREFGDEGPDETSPERITARGVGPARNRQSSNHGEPEAVGNTDQRPSKNHAPAADGNDGPEYGGSDAERPQSGHDEIEFDAGDSYSTDSSPELADTSPTDDASEAASSNEDDEQMGDLPPPPDDSVIRATDASEESDAPRTEGDEGRSTASAAGTPAPPPEQTVGDFLKVAFFGLLAALSVYSSFLVMGTMFGTFLDGTNRLIGSISLALAIPVLTALGETSERERFRVVRRRIDKIARAFMGTAILAFASAALVTLAMPSTVIPQLQTSPNWFLASDDDSTVASLNRRYSEGFAAMLATGTGALGFYTPSEENRARSPGTPERPEPTPSEPSVDGDPGGPKAESGDDSTTEDSPPSKNRQRPRSAIELLQQDDETSGDEADQESQKKGAAGSERRPESSDDSDGASTDGEGTYEKW